MADLFRGRGRVSRLLPLMLFLFVLSSCTVQNVLVVSDPYVKSIYGKYWGPLSPLFILRSRLAGYRIIRSETDTDSNLSEVLSEYAQRNQGQDAEQQMPEIAIISPWNSQYLSRLPESDTRFIIAGGNPPHNLPQWLLSSLRAVVPDRSSVMLDLGEIARNIADSTGKPALLLCHRGNENQSKEIDSLVRGFDNPDSMVIMDLTEEGKEKNQLELPGDFLQNSDNSSVLLLFSGPLNISALSVTDNLSPPVITESLNGSGAWKDRIVASVEDNPRAFRLALLEEMKSQSAESVRYYPAKLSKGVLFGSVSR